MVVTVLLAVLLAGCVELPEQEENLLENGSFQNPILVFDVDSTDTSNTNNNWIFGAYEGAKGNHPGYLTHNHNQVQIHQQPVNIENGKSYTLSFKAWADEPRSIRVFVGSTVGNPDWNNISSELDSVKLTTTATTLVYNFTVSKNIVDPKVSFEFGGATGTVYVTNIRLVEKK